MTKQQKIAAIYEKIANKELSFGCWLDSGRNDGYLLDTSRYLVEKSEGKYELYQSYTNNKITDIVKIIGHPVMIGDVLDWFLKTYTDKTSLRQELISSLWKEKRKPIEDQSDECIDFVYNLISE